MFGRLTRLLNNFEKLNQEKIFVEIVSDNDVQAFIISLNTVEQIFLEGEQSDGSDITSTNDTVGTYSHPTIFEPYFKGQMNPFIRKSVEGISADGGVIFGEEAKSVGVGDPYILSQSGSYLDSYRVEVDSGGFTITSNDSIHSSTGLSSMTGEYGNLEGLTNENKGVLAQQIIPLVVRKVRETLLS